MGLARAEAEAACLRNALQTAWALDGGGASVATAYEKFAGTLAWLRTEAKSRPLRADVLLADNYRRTVSAGRGDGGVRTAWAEFEWRRRLHFALELIFSAVCMTLGEKGQATLSEVVAQWLEMPELPSILTNAWPEVDLAWARGAAEVVASVPENIFLETAPAEALGGMSPHARAIAAFGLVVGLAAQSRPLRTAGDFRDRDGTGELALACKNRSKPAPDFGRKRQVISAESGT
jgi:hypothetical protein